MPVTGRQLLEFLSKLNTSQLNLPISIGIETWDAELVGEEIETVISGSPYHDEYSKAFNIRGRRPSVPETDQDEEWRQLRERVVNDRIDAGFGDGLERDYAEYGAGAIFGPPVDTMSKQELKDALDTHGDDSVEEIRLDVIKALFNGPLSLDELIEQTGHDEDAILDAVNIDAVGLIPELKWDDHLSVYVLASDVDGDDDQD